MLIIWKLTFFQNLTTQKSEYIRIKFQLHKQSEPGCNSIGDVLAIAVIKGRKQYQRYDHAFILMNILFSNKQLTFMYKDRSKKLSKDSS